MPREEDELDDRESRPSKRRRRDEEVMDDDRPRRRRDEEGDRPRRRRPSNEVEATDFLVPTNVSGFSIAACYLGLVSCFLPVLGLLFALIAVFCGFAALRVRKRRPGTYGAVTGDIRAVVGLILGGLTILVHIGFVIYFIVKAK